MISRLKKIKIYRAIRNGILEDEKVKGNRCILSAKEVLKLSEKRFQKMNEVLLPLRLCLSKELNVKGLCFGIDQLGQASIYVNYDDNKFFVISQYDLDDVVEISADFGNVKHNNLIKENKNIIADTFKRSISLNFEQDFCIPSVTRTFMINSVIDEMQITYHHYSQALDILFQYTNNDDEFIVNRDIKSCYQEILDDMENEVNLSDFLNHIKVYEENVPKCLKKVN